ncbi:alpha/beta hydrolase family protein [Embleya sp. AB8]|uniref:alpha/beta hydrolase family protein n=1 Tax=Embleya sp. AB8 TaxID=3156304 RepID=UPI003C75B24C
MVRIQAAERFYTSRGMVALSVEGPDQGETRANGLTLELANYERAATRYIDHLITLPEVDPNRIGVFGISMGAYWGVRATTTERRVRALAVFETPGGDCISGLERAQPTFKHNLMYMAGYTDEEAFEREFAARMPLGDLVRDITSPVRSGSASASSTNSRRWRPRWPTTNWSARPRRCRCTKTSSTRWAAWPPKCSASAPNGWSAP